MKDEYIRQGETFEITLTDSDMTADTAMLTISNETGVVIQQPATYATVEGKRVATIKINSPLLVVGEYDYMYTITYTDGTVTKLPDISECDGECPLPKFIVCTANDITEE